MKKNSLNILLIEDDHLWALKMQQMLEDKGFSINTICYDISTAKTYLSSFKPDIIIADIMLGNNTIFDLLQNGGFEKIPFLFMTSSEDENLYHLSHSVIHSHYLIKPFAAISLEAAITLLLKTITITPIQTDGIKVKGLFGERMMLKEEHIYFIQAQKNNVKLFAETEHFVLKASLLSFEQKLSKAFVRINRAYLLNKNHIQKISFEKMEIITKVGVVPIGSYYKAQAEYLQAEIKGYTNNR